MKKGWIAFVLALAVAVVVGLIVWSQYEARAEAEQTLGLEASRVLDASFSNAAALKVGTLSGRIVARGEDEGFLGVMKSEQTTIMPVAVDYFVDLSSLDADSYRWDSETKTLTIDIPDVTIAEPNIDETEARSDQKGLYISRRASLALARETSRRAALRAGQEAKKPENLDKARANARAEIARMAEGPLAAAGLEEVRVAVSFPWEPKDSSDISAEQWDRSRRMEDVLKERQAPR